MPVDSTASCFPRIVRDPWTSVRENLFFSSLLNQTLILQGIAELAYLHMFIPEQILRQALLGLATNDVGETHCDQAGRIQEASAIRAGAFPLTVVEGINARYAR